MLRNYLGRINKSARYPFGQISVECRELIRQILHETSILEIRGDHVRRERAETERDWRRAQDEIDDAERDVRDVRWRFRDQYGSW